jgi:aminopeptidase
MNSKTIIPVLLVSMFLGFFCTATPAQDQKTDPRIAEIAHKVVTVSAGVQPGEVVAISGNEAHLAFMEALAIEALKAGAVVPIFVTTDRIQRSIFTEVPDQYLGQPDPTLVWLKNVNVWISTGDIDDSKAVLDGVPDTKIAKARQSADALRKELEKSKFRGVYIGVPDKYDATYAEVDWKTYQNMIWDAINADYTAIATKADALTKILETGKTVHITSPAGSDITFALDGKRAYPNVGMPAHSDQYISRQATLPGGDVVVVPVESSANGKVIAPKDVCEPYEYLTGATYIFQNGRMTSFTAKNNAQCFEKMYAAYSGDKDRIATIQIGLNPALRVMEDKSEFRPLAAAGMVMLGMGQNQLFGGNNKTEFGWYIPIVNATVSVDGNTIIKDGKLTF